MTYIACSRCLRHIHGSVIAHWNQYHLALLLEIELKRMGIDPGKG
jgi:hypothetical protein